MGDARSPGPGVGDRRADHGDPTAAARSRIDSPLRPGQSICRLRLPHVAESQRYRVVDEPEGQLLGQCADGKLVPHPQDRASGLDYHGYHPYDWTRIDPRLESSDATYQDLIDQAHALGIKIIQDVVINHSC